MKDKTNNLEFAASLYVFVEDYGMGKRDLWREAAKVLNKRFGLQLASETYRSMYARLRHKYGMVDSKRWAYVKRRPKEELLEAVRNVRVGRVLEEVQGEGDGAPNGAGDGGMILTDNFDILIPSSAPSTTEEGRRIKPATEAEMRQVLRDVVDDEYGRPDKDEDDEPIDKELLQLLKRPRTLDELSQRFSLKHVVIEFIIERLIREGYNIMCLGNEYLLETRAVSMGANFYAEKWNGAETITKGIVSDTHLGNKCQQRSALHHFYRLLEERQVEETIHGGDMLDGLYRDRAEHIYETFLHGADEQIAYAVEVYPGFTLKNGKPHKTRFIDGNHDFTHTRNSGIRTGRIIAAARPDMEYLGYGKARIMFTPNCPVDIVHPLDGKAYALSYRLQKNIDAMQGGTKPKIMFCGHYHSFCYIIYRNIHAFMLPAFMAQNLWATLKSMMVQVGGIILTTKVSKDGDVLSIIPEVVPYYVMQENDY